MKGAFPYTPEGYERAMEWLHEQRLSGRLIHINRRGRWAVIDTANQLYRACQSGQTVHDSVYVPSG